MRKQQEKAAAFARSHGLSMAPQIRFADLVSELGELSKELLKASDYGTGSLALTAGMEEELGDCVFSLLCLADCLGIDAEDALDGVLAKYERRFSERGEVGSGR